MTITVKVLEAKTDLSRVLGQVLAGEEIIQTKAGKPSASLVRLLGESGPRRPGRLKGRTDITRLFDALPGSELDAWDGR